MNYLLTLVSRLKGGGEEETLYIPYVFKNNSVLCFFFASFYKSQVLTQLKKCLSFI